MAVPFWSSACKNDWLARGRSSLPVWPYWTALVMSISAPAIVLVAPLVQDKAPMSAMVLAEISRTPLLVNTSVPALPSWRCSVLAGAEASSSLRSADGPIVPGIGGLFAKQKSQVMLPAAAVENWRDNRKVARGYPIDLAAIGSRGKKQCRRDRGGIEIEFET